MKRAEKDAREPSLTKAIIKCYWKSCLVLGIFTFLEVKFFYILCVAFKCVQISTEMDEMRTREDRAFMSEVKTSL